MLKNVLALTVLLIVSGCSNNATSLQLSEPELFTKASEFLQKKSYKNAEKYFLQYLTSFPYGENAQIALLNLAYSQYKTGDYDQAIAQYINFIKTYKGSQYIDFAHYMVALILSEKDLTFYNKINKMSLTQTNISSLEKALSAFKDLVNNFPDSKYVPLANQKITYLTNLIASNVLEIGDFYLRRDAYVAAIDRANQVIEQYKATPSYPYALAIVFRAYHELGEEDSAKKYLDALNKFFPELLNNSEIKEYLYKKLAKSKGFLSSFRGNPKTHPQQNQQHNK